MPFRGPYRIAIVDRRRLSLCQCSDLSIEPLRARVGREVAPNDFLKVDCCVLCIFSLNLDLDLPTWFLGSNSLGRKQILRGPLVCVVARRSASVVRHGVDYCCVKKGSQFDCCVFFVFSLN